MRYGPAEIASLREYERRYGVSRVVLAREVAEGRLAATRIGVAIVARDSDVRVVVARLLSRALAADEGRR